MFKITDMTNKFFVAAAAAMILFSTQAFAQIGVGAGFNNTTVKTESSLGDTSYGAPGIYFGIDFTQELSFGFSTTGGLVYTACSIDRNSKRRSEQAINIPLSLNYGLEIDPEIRGILSTGPVFGLCTVSRYITDDNFYFNNFKEKDLGRFKFQWNIGVGAELMGRYRFNIGYAFGLNNRNKSKSVPGTVKNNDLHVGVAYLFW